MPEWMTVTPSPKADAHSYLESFTRMHQECCQETQLPMTFFTY